MQARTEWSEIFKLLKKTIHQPRILHLVKVSFTSEGTIYTLYKKQKLRKFVASTWILQELFLKKVFQREWK